MRHVLRTLAFAVGVALAQTACYRWQPAELSPDATSKAQGQWKLMRVRLNTGDAIKVINPRIVNDTLIANYAPRERDEITAEVRFALLSVNGIDHQRLKPVETTLLVVAIAAPVFALYVATHISLRGIGAFPVGSW